MSDRGSNVKKFLSLCLIAVIATSMLGCNKTKKTEAEGSGASAGEDVEDVKSDSEAYFVWQDNVIIGLSKDAPTSGAITIPARAEGIDGSFLTTTENTIDTVNFESDDNIVLDGAFANTKHLKSVNLPANLSEIAYMAFSNATGIESILIPDNVEIIREMAFFNANNLVKVEMGDKVKRIEEEAFSNARALTDIELSDSIETIKARAFEGVDSLVSFTLPKGLKDIDVASLSGASLEKIIVPKEVTLSAGSQTAFFNLGGVDIHVTEGSYMDIQFDQYFKGATKVIDK